MSRRRTQDRREFGHQRLSAAALDRGAAPPMEAHETGGRSPSQMVSQMGCTSDPCDVAAKVLGKLHRGTAHCTRRAVDKHALAVA